jgi:hypothetical protein
LVDELGAVIFLASLLRVPGVHWFSCFFSAKWKYMLGLGGTYLVSYLRLQEQVERQFGWFVMESYFPYAPEPDFNSRVW